MSFNEGIIDRTGTQTMLYALTCIFRAKNGYLKTVIFILPTVKKYRIFFTSDEYDLYFFQCSKQRQFRQFRA